MNKEQYLAELSEIKKSIIELKQKESDLKEKYIAENRVFVDGELIKVTTPERRAIGTSVWPEMNRLAYIKNAFISERDGEVKYELFKAKSDMTISDKIDSVYITKPYPHLKQTYEKMRPRTAICTYHRSLYVDYDCWR